MDKQIDKGIIVIVICIIVLILLCIGYIVYEKTIEEENNTTTTLKTTMNQITNKIEKIDNTKDYVYDANYTLNIEKETYIINDKTYTINDYKVPFINLNSYYTNNINNKIKELYTEAINIYNEGAKNETNTLDIFKYDYYLNNDILSIIITYRYGGMNELHNNYKNYNLNIKTGEKISFDDIISYKNLSKNEIINKVKDKILEEYNKSYENIDNEDLYKNYYESLKEETINKFGNGENIEYFIDNNNKINVIATISIPEGRGYKETIITIDE